MRDELLRDEVKDIAGLQTVGEDPRFQDAISREQAQCHGVRMRARTFPLETDARATVQITQRSRTQEDLMFSPGQRLLV